MKTIEHYRRHNAGKPNTVKVTFKRKKLTLVCQFGSSDYVDTFKTSEHVYVLSYSHRYGYVRLSKFDELGESCGEIFIQDSQDFPGLTKPLLDYSPINMCKILSEYIY